MNSANAQAQACVACEGQPAPENTPCAVCGAGQPAARAEPVAWRIRHRSDLGMIGHYPWFFTDRIRGGLLEDKYEYEPLFAAPAADPVSAEQAALVIDLGQAETRMNTGHAQQNVDHVGQAGELEVAAQAQQDGYGYHEGNNPPNSLLYQCMVPFHLNLCRGQELRSVIDYGRIVWKQARQYADKVDALASTIAGLKRYTYGYTDDGFGVARHLGTIEKPDGRFFLRDEVLAAIDAARKEAQP